MFIADALGKPLALGEQISLLLFMIIASKGAAGVTGAGLATLAGGLSSHRPDLVDGVGLIVGIDRFMSEARAVTNFSGNAVATVLIGKWVGEFDQEKADAGAGRRGPVRRGRHARRRRRGGPGAGRRRRVADRDAAATTTPGQADQLGLTGAGRRRPGDSRRTRRYRAHLPAYHGAAGTSVRISAAVALAHRHPLHQGRPNGCGPQRRPSLSSQSKETKLYG